MVAATLASLRWLRVAKRLVSPLLKEINEKWRPYTRASTLPLQQATVKLYMYL